MLIRLQKYLANAGIASRRKAEALILAGQIKINGQVKKELGTQIDPAKDKVYFQGKLIRPQNKLIYIMLNKPAGYTCTTKEFKGEKNVLDLVKIPEKIFLVGRLDKDSQGLIFLTNDGDWAYKLTHPKFQIEKEYQVMVSASANALADKRQAHHDIAKNLDQMKKGLKDQGDLLKIESYKINSPVSVNLILTQGHKREIRRLFGHFDYPIKELKRIRIDKWKLGDLAEGKWKYFTIK